MFYDRIWATAILLLNSNLITPWSAFSTDHPLGTTLNRQYSIRRESLKWDLFERDVRQINIIGEYVPECQSIPRDARSSFHPSTRPACRASIERIPNWFPNSSKVVCCTLLGIVILGMYGVVVVVVVRLWQRDWTPFHTDFHQIGSPTILHVGVFVCRDDCSARPTPYHLCRWRTIRIL